MFNKVYYKAVEEESAISIEILYIYIFICEESYADEMASDSATASSPCNKGIISFR